ncbi:SpoIIE family protein phosphatase [Nonomuraea phyllanthi]|uniref:SpoIIE family protein phosphatase n=1 Tax=Nonomuraea phyllanthi TaxID=2219224 RepID=A0A5C4W9P0_9ACTN|nr:PP2C family protein-serine/threonine phosphatase [Nonomuraea phyllanthi]KAB8192728.1 SpoIIE family protein phosphatase [Nonomuraea phyllanthi]
MPTALVVTEPADPTSPAVLELDGALRAEGFEVELVVPDDLVLSHPHPDLLLISAALGLQRMALVSQRFLVDGRMPTIVAFPDDDLGALEECVRAGFDYVTRPFLPGLLRSRANSCWERWQLSTAVEEMAALASLREYERELRIARDIQAGFLPESLPRLDGWEIAASFRPARQVAGDFYDVFTIVNGRRLALVVADVCDKGVGAALFMALIRTLLRHTAEHTGYVQDVGDDAAASLDRALDGPMGESALPLLSLGAGPLIQAVVGTNRYMARNHLKQAYFATMFFGVLDPCSGDLVYINGGHNPPIVVRADGRQTLLPPTGPAVGILADSSYTLGHVQLGPGDALFAYTDGVVEARNAAHGLFGTPRLQEVLGASGAHAEGLLAAVDGAVRTFVGAAEQSDDITTLALTRNPSRTQRRHSPRNTARNSARNPLPNQAPDPR